MLKHFFSIAMALVLLPLSLPCWAEPPDYSLRLHELWYQNAPVEKVSALWRQMLSDEELPVYDAWLVLQYNHFPEKYNASQIGRGIPRTVVENYIQRVNNEPGLSQDRRTAYALDARMLLLPKPANWFIERAWNCDAREDAKPSEKQSFARYQCDKLSRDAGRMQQKYANHPEALAAIRDTIALFEIR